MKINKRDCNLISKCLKMISDQAVQARTSCFFTEPRRCKGYCVSCLFFFFSHSQRQKLDLCSFLGLIDFFSTSFFFFVWEKVKRQEIDWQHRIIFLCLQKMLKPQCWAWVGHHYWDREKEPCSTEWKKNVNDEKCAFFFFVAPWVY